jgi:hypothetical protein
MKRSTWKRKPAKQRPRKPAGRPNEFPDDVKGQARRRSGNRCEAASAVCSGGAEHFHHRKLKGMGGRSVDNRLENCLHVCRRCHIYMHDQPVLAKLMGWIVHSTLDPAEVPVRRGDGGAGIG